MKELTIFLGGLALLVLGGGFLVSRSGTSSGPVQPINFSHQKHTPFLECIACHSGVTAGPAATLPRIEKCMTCHQAPVTANPEAEKVKAFAAAGQEPAWVRLFRLAPDIVYSHKVHVGGKGLACTTCHGDIASAAQITRGFGSRGLGGMSGRQLMEFCLSCHRQQAAGAAASGDAARAGRLVDCLTCHK